MWRAAFLPWPIADGDGALGGHHVAAGEDARVAGHHVRSDLHDAVLDLDARHAVEQRQVGLLAEREHERVGLELLELAGRLREAGLVELHLLEHELAVVGVLDRREPLASARPPRAPPRPRSRARASGRGCAGRRRSPPRRRAAWPCGRRPSRCCRRRRRRRAGRAAAAPRPPCCAARETASRILRGRAGRDVGALADVGADGEERGVEAALAHRVRRGRSTLRFELQLDAQVEDALDLGVEDVARQPVARDAEAHHAAGVGPASWIVTAWPSRREVVGGRQPGRAGADDEHALAGRRRVDRRRSSPAGSPRRRGSARPS